MRRIISVFVVALAIVVACRIPDEHYVVGDGPAHPSDATTDSTPPPCVLTKQFEAPTTIPGLDTLGSVARFSSDETTAYFGLDTDGSGSGAIELYQAVRAGSGAFTARTKLDGVADVLGVSTPATAPNDLAIYYVHDEVNGGSARDLYYATRAVTQGDFSNPKPVGGVNDGSSEDDYPFIASNGDLWFASKRGDNTVAIYQAISVGGNGFEAPSEIVQLNDIALGNNYPVLTPDLLQIFFSRLSGGTEVLYTATRGSAGDTFSTPMTVDTINAIGSFRPSWISPDGCRLYLGFGLPTAPIRMYVASRPAM